MKINESLNEAIDRLNEKIDEANRRIDMAQAEIDFQRGVKQLLKDKKDAIVLLKVQKAPEIQAIDDTIP